MGLDTSGVALVGMGWNFSYCYVYPLAAFWGGLIRGELEGLGRERVMMGGVMSGMKHDYDTDWWAFKNWGRGGVGSC